MAQIPNKPNVVVVGGSYVGAWAAQFIAEAMHKTHKTILIEKNSHFQHLFAFPRFAVVPGHEHLAFVPFTDRFFANGPPPGSTSIVRAKVTDILPNKVLLDQGEIIDYEYLVMATGTKLPSPGTLTTLTKADGILVFQKYQDQVSRARRIAIIGGGAVGVQMATDIKDRFPEKTVTLVHSRAKLMNSFHSRLHDIVIDRCNELGIEVILGDRVKVPPNGYSTDPSASTFDIELTSGRKVSTNFAIACTGQTPLSDPLKSLSPSSIDPQRGFILVKPTLQISDTQFPNIFALGDVAMTGGPKAAKPGSTQAQIVAHNIAKLAAAATTTSTTPANSNDGKLETYTPDVAAIHLTLGLKVNVGFRNPSSPDEEPVIKMQDNGVEDMNCLKIWNLRAPGLANYHL